MHLYLYYCILYINYMMCMWCDAASCERRVFNKNMSMCPVYVVAVVSSAKKKLLQIPIDQKNRIIYSANSCAYYMIIFLLSPVYISTHDLIFRDIYIDIISLCIISDYNCLYTHYKFLNGCGNWNLFFGNLIWYFTDFSENGNLFHFSSF